MIRIMVQIRKAVEIYKETGKGRIPNRVFEVQIKAFGNPRNPRLFYVYS